MRIQFNNPKPKVLHKLKDFIKPRNVKKGDRLAKILNILDNWNSSVFKPTNLIIWDWKEEKINIY